MERLFPTFCHISEYGDRSHRHLHRLVALSAPLVVWGPSAIDLDAYGGAFTPLRFLSLVDDGAIQVVGRELWLTNATWRNDQPWPGAAWRPGFDDVLLEWLIKDESKGTAARVRKMPAEQGRAVASHHLGTEGLHIPHKDLYDRVLALFDEKKVPLGTRQKAERAAERIVHRNAGYEKLQKRRAIASEIVRDAFNHTDAVNDSDSKLPFWEPDDGAFIALVDGAPRPPSAARPLGRDERTHLRDYLRQTSELLGKLENVEPAQAVRADDPESFRRFLKSEQRGQLVEWVRLHAEKARRREITDERLGRFILEELREDLDESLPVKGLPYALNMSHRALARVIASASLIVSLVSAVESYQEALEWISVTLLAFAVGERVVLPHDSQFGTNWPFLYAFGDERDHVRRVL